MAGYFTLCCRGRNIEIFLYLKKEYAHDRLMLVSFWYGVWRGRCEVVDVSFVLVLLSGGEQLKWVTFCAALYIGNPSIKGVILWLHFL